MFSGVLLRNMPRSAVAARTSAIARHLMSTSAAPPSDEALVKFESVGSLRSYVLNRPKKLNVLNEPMLSLLRPKIEEWGASDLCGVIVGRAEGRAFCAGGDVEAVVKDVLKPDTVPNAIKFFKREFEMDYILATLKKPYVAILDGFTLGGGAGLAANAHFRIATERTLFGMPETKIGYCPDVGGSFFLSRMDGEIGTYLALTSASLSGRAVFEHGFATHYIPSRRVPMLLDRLAELSEPSLALINRTIEDLSAEREPTEPPAPFTGPKREALDHAFRHDEVEKIISDLEAFAKGDDQVVKEWATETLSLLHLRSPTSLKVALEAIRRGRFSTLLETLEMELKIATAFCRGASPDFVTGVRSVLVEKSKERPNWEPSSLSAVTANTVSRFFDDSEFTKDAPSFDFSADVVSRKIDSSKYALPSEEEIRKVVIGSQQSTALQVHELVARFKEMREGKIGVEEKIREVVERKCDLVDNADGNQVWLKWRY